MPRVIITEGTALGVERCRAFLAEKSPLAAQRAAQAILRHLALLQQPQMGRPLAKQPDLRELVIGFGDLGYVALYRHEPKDDAVYMLALRHQRGRILSRRGGLADLTLATLAVPSSEGSACV